MLRVVHVLLGMVFMINAWAEAQEPRFITRARQLTFDGRRAGEGYFHPSGEKLIFQSEREPGNPFYQIYILDFETGDVHRVSPGAGKTTCAFFQPGSDRVLYASTHLDPESEALQEEELGLRASGEQRRYSWDYDLHYDIFSSGQDGSAIERLTDAVGYDAEGSYSPDGSKIAFTSIRDAYPLDKLSGEEAKKAEIDLSYFAEIYIMDADGSNETRLTMTPGYDGGPFFTPDGERIVWRRFDEEGLQAEIYTMALDGSDVRQITRFGAMSWAPYFHPTGEYLIFASNKLGFDNFELYIVDRDGAKEPQRASFVDGFDGLPVFTPDGEHLAWTSTRHGGGREGGQLYFGNWDHEAALAAIGSAPERAIAGATSRPTTRPAIVMPDHVFSADATEADLAAHVGFLASEELAGRQTGTKGEQLAAAYIAEHYTRIGLKPLGDWTSFEQEFDFTAGFSAGEDNAMSAVKVAANPHTPLEELISGGEKIADFAAGEDFNPLAISEDGLAEGVLAFAGYGLVVPGDDGGFDYNSYEELDVEGKVVMVLRYVPEDVTAEDRQKLNRYAGLRYKALQARERGAAGLLVVSGPSSPNAGKLIGLGMDFGAATSGIPAASISLATADRLLAASGTTVEQLQSELDSGEPKLGMTSYETVVQFNADLVKETRVGRNVIGVLPPEGGISASTEYVIIGAHYDHLGQGTGGNSLAHKGEQNDIHYGADDNASGIGSMLEIAARVAAEPDDRRTRAIVFAAWSGEEMGLLGSNAFTKSPPFDLASAVGYLNMDMVGRVRENKLIVQGVGSSDGWRGLLERKNIRAGFSMRLTEDPYLPTDVMSLYLAGVPGLHFFSGAHEDYHRPTDTPDKINYEDLARVTDFVQAVAEEMARSSERIEYAKVERSMDESGGGRDSLRAYIGTIPDYAEELKGVLLSGVREGGPADKAGIQGGDVIVNFAGQSIENIYDYTYALDAVKIDEPIEVIIQRNGEAITLTVTPVGRE